MWLFVFSILFFLVSPRLTLAQSTIGVSAIPPRLELVAKPGETISHEIKVRNDSETDRDLVITIKDFIVSDDAGTPIAVDTSFTQNRWAASSWLQISPTSFHLKAGQTKSLILSVITPIDALPGGHYVMVLHSPSTTSPSKTGAAVQVNVGTLVYLTVPGPITQKAQINYFNAPSFSEYGPISFTTSIKNLSDIHIAPIGTITITNLLGHITTKLPLIKTNIFPNTSRELINTLDRKWLFGRYRADFSAAYGTAGGLLTATLFFWVIPWRFILLLLLCAIFIILLLIFLHHHPRFSPQKEIKKIEKKYR